SLSPRGERTLLRAPPVDFGAAPCSTVPSPNHIRLRIWPLYMASSPRRACGEKDRGLRTCAAGFAMTRKYHHIAVLMGGWSAEREVSLNSGAACANALEGAGYRVTRVDAQRDIADRLTALKPDACFNALHGKGGEDGCIQGLLETLQIPYTHSGV